MWQHVGRVGCVGCVQFVQVACKWHWQYLTLNKVLIANELQRVCVRCKMLGV